MCITNRTVVLLKLLPSPDALRAWKFVLTLLVFLYSHSNPLLNSLPPTVPSVAPANVSGGNGRRHELVILWEVSPRTHHLCCNTGAGKQSCWVWNFSSVRFSYAWPVIIFICCAALLKTGDAFWLLNFGCFIGFGSSEFISLRDELTNVLIKHLWMLLQNNYFCNISIIV